MPEASSDALAVDFLAEGAAMVTANYPIRSADDADVGPPPRSETSAMLRCAVRISAAAVLLGVAVVGSPTGGVAVASGPSVYAPSAPVNPVAPLGWVTYTTFGEEPYETLNLYPYKGSNIAILANSDSLDAATMSKWLRAIDGAYNFYASATGQEPDPLDGTVIDGLATIARVDVTCGAGCGQVGATGIEILSSYFDEFYNRLKEYGQFGQIPFYELGRNFWFYGDRLDYQDVPGGPEPADIPTGYAVFMRFMSMEYLGLEGAPFGDLDFNEFLSQIRGLIDHYLANESLTWANTLDVGEGIDGWGATDLFASFCFYLEENYGGMNWVQNVWRYAGEQPAAHTTQDAVDNFIIAASEAAETNLVRLFETWRWPISQAAIGSLEELLPA